MKKGREGKGSVKGKTGKGKEGLNGLMKNVYDKKTKRHTKDV